MTRPPHRRVSRILLFDEHDAVLLMMTASPLLSTPVVRWLTPGGGVEDHESHSEGAIRELFEETGLSVDEIGEPVHTVQGISEFADGTVQSTYAEFFVTRTSRFDPVNDNWMENEFVDITDIRWWTAEELEASGEPFAPLNLPDLIRAHRKERRER
jgi:8-oxo-dGTP pyrophosphatase MutT (NUDIX family)